jgi:hypothetical protein
MTMLKEQMNKTQTNHNATKRLLMVPLFIVFVFTMFPNKAHAQVIDTLEVNIPFQFHAGNARLPAGKYSIHVLDNSDLRFMEITSADGSTSALFEVRETNLSSAPAKDELIFNKYGTRYFLAKVFDEGDPSGSEVVESTYEKKVSEATAEAQVHVATLHRQQQGKN